MPCCAGGRGAATRGGGAGARGEKVSRPMRSTLVRTPDAFAQGLADYDVVLAHIDGG